MKKYTTMAHSGQASLVTLDAQAPKNVLDAQRRVRILEGRMDRLAKKIYRIKLSWHALPRLTRMAETFHKLQLELRAADADLAYALCHSNALLQGGARFGAPPLNSEAAGLPLPNLATEGRSTLVGLVPVPPR